VLSAELKRNVLAIKTEAKQKGIFMQTNGRQRKYVTTCIKKESGKTNWKDEKGRKESTGKASS
jgi:hypothetical protein